MTGYGSFDSKERRSPEGIGKSRRFKKIVRLNYSYSDRPRIPSISVGVAYDIENKPISVNTFGAVLPDVTSEVDLNTASETDIEDSKRYQPNILERALERTICYNFRSREKPSNITVVVLCMLTIISNMAFLILCPMYLLSMRKAGGDAMVAALSLVTVVPLPLVAVSLFLKHIWNKNITLRPNASLPLYSALGASLAIKINITLYASHPARTPTTLQPALSSSFILFSLGAAILILKKECSARRIVCCVVAIVAVLIGIEPKLWSLGGNSDQLFASQYLVERILWPAIYSSSYLPMAIYCAAAESELKKNVVHPFSLSTSGLLSSCVFTVLLSGTNFLPWYGYVNDWPEMWDNFKSGYKCNFNYAPGCNNCPFKLIVLAVSFICLNAFTVILISASEGTVLTSLVSATASPLVAVFWSVFHFDNETDDISWRPKWTHSTAFNIASLVLLLSAIVLYNVFTIKDAKQARREQKGYSDVSSSEYEWD
ncbi:uncharacterized protein LOC106050661 [Biomphalaria glabrata]|uniref:Uncharacterized protein LOC106050661 n=2 Tax=Biomphalaria glabrata TaxID=6526 RepID=A0A9W2YYT8_BIOGL|nr:uncharacterized protein LOC106050661 [Biomphalaria glabrata]